MLRLATNRETGNTPSVASEQYSFDWNQITPRSIQRECGLVSIMIFRRFLA